MKYASHVFLSDDDGETWSKAELPGELSGQPKVVEFADGRLFVEGDRAYALRRVFYSTDRGTTWKARKLEGKQWQDMTGGLFGGIDSLIAALELAIWRSDDGRGAFEVVHRFDQRHYINGFSAATTGPSLLVGGKGLIMRSADHGQSYALRLVHAQEECCDRPWPTSTMQSTAWLRGSLESVYPVSSSNSESY